ncbi:hypothetical protein RBG61_13815 [Paludicola sp. MB14-C6]|uniref:hypothetical protein n=1 Tax=Paludihabitans sp. MB14-C6 TaxID=3070656 RepID=UPI0027DC5B58|nr:hypothetical protein [Paludicola sp. MB14-C6]WMJ23047.1 hypothetical protein RBG61_13815 [Paludicola sp. MB14-C6]
MKKYQNALTPEELKEKEERQKYETMEKSDSFKKFSPFTTHPVTKSGPFALSGLAQASIFLLSLFVILGIISVVFQKCQI